MTVPHYEFRATLVLQPPGRRICVADSNHTCTCALVGVLLYDPFLAQQLHEGNCSDRCPPLICVLSVPARDPACKADRLGACTGMLVV